MKKKIWLFGYEYRFFFSPPEVEDDNMNIKCLSGRIDGPSVGLEIGACIYRGQI